MATSYLHEYHFVMGRSMKESLQGLDMFEKTGSLSGIIVRILLLFYPVIKREHKWGEQRMSRYMPVSDDPDEKRDHVHVYFPGNVYRLLKLMHQDLNVYSIAQLIRFFLEIFLDLVRVYGDNLFQEITKLYKQWNVESKKNQLTPRKFIRQLYIIIQHLPGQSRLINIYDNQFSPFWIFRL